MNERDLFVGIVAIALGFYYVVIAITNAQHHFKLYSSRMLVKFFGEQKARFVLALFGGVMVFLGLYIISSKNSAGSRIEKTGFVSASVTVKSC